MWKELIITTICLMNLNLQGNAATGETPPIPPFIDDPAVIGTWVSVDFGNTWTDYGIPIFQVFSESSYTFCCSEIPRTP